MKKSYSLKLDRSWTDSRHLSIDCYLSRPSFFLSWQKLTQSWSIKLSGLCLDSFSIASRSIEKLSVWLIHPRHLLDLSRSSYMHCFSHVLHLSFILSSIASCFISFTHLYGFLVPSWSSLIIFMFLGWNSIASCTLCQSWQKGGEYVVSF